MPEEKKNQQKNTNNLIAKVVELIEDANNILVALSKNPSVDEMSAALGLTMMLDKMGKHATAIYSGETPNALEFLEPGKTFETNTNSLRDFIIALNKEKADHLRYKIDGDYVKVFITPYKTTIDEGDLEFSHGNYNVDLIIAVNVSSANELDGALSEHGRIMHDASAINITTGVPGRLGEVEWSNPAASSVSEMVAELANALRAKYTMGKEEATALLTGIVAETKRFSNEKTTPETMGVASRLMSAGANQQLISANIENAVMEEESNLEVTTDDSNVGTQQAVEPSSELKIDNAGQSEGDELQVTSAVEQVNEVQPVEVQPVVNIMQPSEVQLVVNTTQPGEVQPVVNAGQSAEVAMSISQPENQTAIVTEPIAVAQPVVQEEMNSPIAMNEPVTAASESETPDYAKLIEEALEEPLPTPAMQVSEPAPVQMTVSTDANPAIQAAPIVSTVPEENNIPEMNYLEVPVVDDKPITMGEEYLVSAPGDITVTPEMGMSQAEQVEQMAQRLQQMQQPAVQSTPQPVVQPGMVQGGEILPPAPMPPVDFSMMPPQMPMQQPAMSAQMPMQAAPQAPQVQPVMPQTSIQPAAQPMQPAQPMDPAAFHIPGM